MSASASASRANDVVDMFHAFAKAEVLPPDAVDGWLLALSVTPAAGAAARQDAAGRLRERAGKGNGAPLAEAVGAVLQNSEQPPTVWPVFMREFAPRANMVGRGDVLKGLKALLPELTEDDALFARDRLCGRDPALDCARLATAMEKMA